MKMRHGWISQPAPLHYFLATVLFVVVAVTLIETAAPTAAQGTTNCGSTTVTLTTPDGTRLQLPDQEGQTLKIEPDEPLTVFIENAPTSGALRLEIRLPFGATIRPDRPLAWSNLPSNTYSETLFPDDYGSYVKHLRGRYKVQAELSGPQRFICEVEMELRIGGFDGVAAPASAAVAVTAGAAAAGAGTWAGAASNAKLKLSIAIRKSRRTGLRRWIPTIAWRKTITSTVIGVITGLLASLALQQAGLVPLSTTSITNSMAIGGGASFSVGMAWGSIAAFIRSNMKPDSDEDAAA